MGGHLFTWKLYSEVFRAKGLNSCNFLTSDLFLSFRHFYGAENVQNKKLEEIKTNLRTLIICTGVPGENGRSMGTTRWGSVSECRQLAGCRETSLAVIPQRVSSIGPHRSSLWLCLNSPSYFSWVRSRVWGVDQRFACYLISILTVNMIVSV